MTDTPEPASPDGTASGKRGIWLRALLMVLMAIAFHVACTLLGVLALIQFALALVADRPNARLRSFGQSLGCYLRQIADFVCFAAEDVPFPFSDWPVGR